MARRVAAERGLGRRVHAPLRGVAVLLGGGIEIGAAGVGDDRDVAVGLTARGERPRDLAVVEDVDVLVDDDDALHVEIGAEDGHDRVLGLADQALLDRDIAGERRRHANGAHRRHHRAHGAIEVGLHWNGREQHVVEVGDGDVLEHRVAPVRDRLHLDDLALALAEAVAGELAERPLGRALAGQELALQHHLGVRGHQHVGGLALDQLERLAEQPAHDRALVLVDRADGERAERDGRVHADHEPELQRLAALLGDLLELPEVLAEREVDRRRVAALDHEPVVRAIPGLRGGVLRERDGGGDVRPCVALMVHDLRQRVEVHLRALQHDLVHGRGSHHARRDRLLHRAQVGLEHRVGRAVERRGQPRAARVDVGQHGEPGALDVLEEQHRALPTLLLELHDQGSDLVRRVDGARDYLELVRLAPLDGVQIAAEILAHGGSLSRDQADSATCFRPFWAKRQPRAAMRRARSTGPASSQPGSGPSQRSTAWSRRIMSPAK